MKGNCEGRREKAVKETTLGAQAMDNRDQETSQNPAIVLTGNDTRPSRMGNALCMEPLTQDYTSETRR